MAEVEHNRRVGSQELEPFQPTGVGRGARAGVEPNSLRRLKRCRSRSRSLGVGGTEVDMSVASVWEDAQPFSSSTDGMCSVFGMVRVHNRFGALSEECAESVAPAPGLTQWESGADFSMPPRASGFTPSPFQREWGDGASQCSRQSCASGGGECVDARFARGKRF